MMLVCTGFIYGQTTTKTMTAREIAEKYVYGRHDSLTDKQEVEDMIKDIKEHTKTINKNQCIPTSLYAIKITQPHKSNRPLQL